MKIKENEKRDKYLDLTRELTKLWNMTVTVIPVVTGALRTVTKVFRYIVIIFKNIEKSPGDLRRDAVTQTPVTDHHLTLM